MNVGILGTGSVGNAIGTKLIQLGHTVKMGSRTGGHEKAVLWVNQNGTAASEGTFRDAASFGELIVLCLNGAGTINALKMAGIENFKGKTVIDITNPLDFSRGMPPGLFVSNNDSLGEEVQRTLPDAAVVKTLNIVTAGVMVNPALLSQDTDMLLCGNDEKAKATVVKLLEDFGWKTIIDLGSIQSARNMETYVLLWVNLWQKFGDPYFGVKFVKK
ncbi:MAG TPA: NAD(P)-binding domain-containing protein [Chitinophagales bacterium]|nr:NAD(P)-binding domain-containing protein [Chitinophagales bacterium]